MGFVSSALPPLALIRFWVCAFSFCCGRRRFFAVAAVVIVAAALSGLITLDSGRVKTRGIIGKRFWPEWVAMIVVVR